MNILNNSSDNTNLWTDLLCVLILDSSNINENKLACF